MSMTKRSKKFFFFTVMSGFLFLQGCVLFWGDNEEKDYKIQKEQYEPYRMQNTIEGYREFIAAFPKNCFIIDARQQIENLEFAPYEQANSIEGYMDFKVKYPRNRHTYKTDLKIEQLELKRYEALDALQGYREFATKYPASTFSMLAKERLQELEFRELDDILQHTFGFDLLRYRLNLKRVNKESEEKGDSLGELTYFASIVLHEDKRYFHTHLIIPGEFPQRDAGKRDLSEKVFDRLISKALIYLNKNFKKKDELVGFSFDFSTSVSRYYGDRKVLFEFYFLKEEVEQFASGGLDKKDLLARSTVLFPVHGVSGLQGEKAQGKDNEVPLVPDGAGIMKLAAERDTWDDVLISSIWRVVKGPEIRAGMKCMEIRKNLKGRDGLVDKTIIRYIDPPEIDGRALMTWNYQDRGREFWCVEKSGEAKKVSDPERCRSAAEKNLCRAGYLDLKPGEERHDLLRSEVLEGKDCYVVASVPLSQDIPYGKRISWIDKRWWTPCKVEYYDRAGVLWKTLKIDWQGRYGSWFWKKATVDNHQTGEQTQITIGDVRVNVGLEDQEFSSEGLK